MELSSRPVKNITISIYQDQYNFLKENGMNISTAYRDALDEKYLLLDVKSKKLKELQEEMERLQEEISNEINKPLSREEIIYLKESKESPTSPIQAQKARLEGFKYHFGRHYLTMDEFLELVKKVNNNG